MNKKEIIEKISTLFFGAEEVTEKFVDIKTADNRILRLDDLQPGFEVKEVTEDGVVDLEDAEYLLENGLVLRVVEGKIEEIIEPEAQEEPAVEEAYSEVTEEVEEKFEAAEEVTEEIIAELAEEVKAEEFEATEEFEEHEDEEKKEEYLDVVSRDEFEVFKAELKAEHEALKAAIESIKADKELAMSALETVKAEFSAFKSEPSAKAIDTKIKFKDLSREDKLKQLRRK